MYSESAYVKRKQKIMRLPKPSDGKNLCNINDPLEEVHNREIRPDMLQIKGSF